MRRITHLLLVLLTGVWASVNAQVQLQNLPAHPRVLASASRFATLKTQNDAVSRQIRKLIQQEADQLLTTSPTTYTTTGFLMGPMRQVQGRIITLAMAYRLGGDKRYVERARQELRALADLKNWGTNHFLDVGEAALAAGIGLDWLYDDLSADEREHIAQAIITNALQPSLDVQEGVNGWVDGDYNWNQVCNAGLSVGALAIAERDPELAQQIVNRAIKNVPKAGAVYAPDGSYPEGPSYWSYGTSFHVLLIEALRSALGNSYGLEKLPGFLKTADFNLQMVAPSGLDFNFSDYHLEKQNEPIMLWFARELKRRDLATQELADLASLASGLKAGGDQKTAQARSRHLPLELLWWEPGVPVGDNTLPLHWTATGVLPIAVMRSAWNDPRATFVAIKGGTPNHSHAHMDVGSFILEADGVRWAIDLGTESYDKMRAAKLTLWDYSQNSTRWNTFRVGPEGHNILRFDGARQDITGKAEITTLPAEKGAVGNTVYLTPLYRNQVARVQRNVTLRADRSVAIDDQWTAGDRPVQASWQWLTKAEVTKTSQGLLLRQDGQSLALTVEPLAGATIDIEDVSAARAMQDSPNPGLSRIVIRLSTPAKTAASLRVKAIPGSVK
ncbi:heparinase II/III family protein [Spirosoma soli]|uniref:Heparinase II/III family protein n=1 Tax=Spirosoma soli TaxID=1770529 RepID=A0ABW5M1L9_9BACT